MAISTNQKLLLLEKVRITVFNGNEEDIVKLLEDLMSMDETELKVSLRTFAGERRDKVSEQKTKTEMDFDFYDKEATEFVKKK